MADFEDGRAPGLAACSVGSGGLVQDTDARFTAPIRPDVYSRCHQAFYGLAAAGFDVRLHPRQLPDLVLHHVVNVARRPRFAAKDAVDRKIERRGGIRNDRRHRHRIRRMTSEVAG